MYYDINISINGKHLFATSERSATNYREMLELKELFMEKFPAEEGYTITITQWDKVGHLIDVICGL